MEWARGAAFDVPELHVQSAATLPASLQHYTVPGSNILVIRRYDRLGNERIHQEDFAQVVNSPPRLKYDQLTYEQVAALVRAIAGREGFFELVRRLAFVIASGNVDAHLKNWSFLYPDGVNAVLTPMYDQVSTVAWPELKPELALKLAGVKHLLQLTPDTVRRFAARADMDGGETVREFEAAIERIATAWKASGVGDIMPRPHIEALRRYWSRSTLLRRFRGALV
jgi:serine/threonine-protein kinase HipA